MKTTTKILLFIIGILLILSAILYYRPMPIPAGKVLITQAYLDSLADIANQPPRIEIVVDTFWKDTTIYIEKDPPTPTDQGEYYNYADSLKTPEVSIWVWDKISKYGIIEERKWARRLHVPIRITERTTIYQPVPKPYPVYIERNYQSNPKIRYYGMAGFGNLKSLDAGLIYRDKFIGGAQGGVMGDNAVFQVKLGLIF